MITHEAVAADRETAAALELRSRQRVFHAQVVHYEDGRPIQLEDRYVVRDFAPDFLDQDFAQTTPRRLFVGYLAVARGRARGAC